MTTSTEAAPRGEGRWDAAGESLGVLWKAVLLLAATLGAFRLALLLAHRDAPLPGRDLWRALVMGTRFDLKVAAILAGAPLLALGLARVAAGPRGARPLRILSTLWAGIAFAASDLLALANHYFYGFFGSPLSPLAFGLWEDDLGAVLRTIWSDQPVLRAAAGLAALVFVQLRLLGAGRLRLPGGRGIAAAALAASAAALLLLGRGSLGTFPLGEPDLVVSENRFANDLVPSGPEALYVAWRQRRESGIEGGIDAGLERFGFSSPLQAAAALGIRAGTEAELLDALYPPARANPYAAAHPPHVVVALMESWGADVLARHSPGNDLLGRLAPHLSDGTLFRRFFQITDGTDGTVEGLLLATPIIPLTYGVHGLRRYDTSAARPYARRGYRTAFLTSGSSGWRNLGRVLPRQGFDAFYDEHDIARAIPGAARHTWGIHDGPMFEFASRLLEEADRKGKRLFLVILSTSNHPPHEVPPGTVLRPLDLAAFGPKVAAPPALARAMLETTQYACDALGGFLDRLDASGLGGRTVVAATGDHNLRSFYAYPDLADLGLRLGVPLLVHAPAPYLGGRAFDPGRFASPRDLMPTLAGLAIPGERVFASGRDLLLPADRPRALSGFEVVLSRDGVVAGLRQPRLLAWSPGGGLAPCESESCRAPLQKLLGEERAYVALLDWNIRRQALRRGEASAPVGAR